MTPKIFFTRLQNALKLLVWTGTSNKIFGENVFVVATMPGMPLAQIVSPTAYVIEGGFKPHDEHPQIIFQNFQIALFIENIQSEFGQSSILGANQTTSTSRGVGMLDLEREVLDNVIKMISLTDKISIIETGAGKAQFSQAGQPNLQRILGFSTILGLF